MSVEVIATGRLLLRGMVRADFADFAAIWADRDVVAQVGVPVRDDAESWAAFLRNAGQWAIEGYGQWAVCDRETGGFLGQTGFFRALRGYGPAFDDHPEAGWVLGKAAHGRGIGTEAVAAAHRWFDRKIGGPSVAIIAEGNLASVGLARRMGYAVFDARDEDGARALLLRRG